MWNSFLGHVVEPGGAGAAGFMQPETLPSLETRVCVYIYSIKATKVRCLIQGYKSSILSGNRIDI